MGDHYWDDEKQEWVDQDDLSIDDLPIDKRG